MKFTGIDRSRKYYIEWGNPGPERQYHMVSLIIKTLKTNLQITVFKFDWVSV